MIDNYTITKNGTRYYGQAKSSWQTRAGAWTHLLAQWFDPDQWDYSESDAGRIDCIKTLKGQGYKVSKQKDKQS